MFVTFFMAAIHRPGVNFFQAEGNPLSTAQNKTAANGRKRMMMQAQMVGASGPGSFLRSRGSGSTNSCKNSSSFSGNEGASL